MINAQTFKEGYRFGLGIAVAMSKIDIIESDVDAEYAKDYPRGIDYDTPEHEQAHEDFRLKKAKEKSRRIYEFVGKELEDLQARTY